MGANLILGHREQILRATEIQDKFVDESIEFDEETKRGFKVLSQSIRDLLTTNSKLNAYQRKTISNVLLTYWNESMNSITEGFWIELKVNGVAIERKEPLKFALEKNRFRNVEQGIDAKNNWTELKTLKSIKERFSEDDILQIDRIIEADEKARFTILERCLRKKAIPPSQYLKFGECMAYFTNCRLWDKYFTIEQVEELQSIWRNFK